MINNLRLDLVRQYADSLQISFESVYKILSHPYRLGEVNKGFPSLSYRNRKDYL